MAYPRATSNLFLLRMVKDPALDPRRLPVANCEENLNPADLGDLLRLTGTVSYRVAKLADLLCNGTVTIVCGDRKSPGPPGLKLHACSPTLHVN